MMTILNTYYQSDVRLYDITSAIHPRQGDDLWHWEENTALKLQSDTNHPASLIHKQLPLAVHDET